MADINSEIRELIQEHKNIWLQMKFLTDSLIDLSSKSIPAKELIWSYRWNLLDFQEIAQKHIELDERIFNAIPGNHTTEQMAQEHEEIRKQIDSTIILANNAAEIEAEQEKLERYIPGIRDKVNGLCNLIKAHTAREDELFTKIQHGPSE